MRGQDAFYKTGTKLHWRRRVWNAIADRVSDKKNARVLYLPAAEDRDRAVAVSKGFSPNNLIGVDRDIRVVRKLRSEGKICLHASAMDALAAWPASSPLDVVFLDLMGGLTSETFTKAHTLSMSPAVHKNTVIAANMLRGREGKNDSSFLYDLKNRYQVETKHRGKIYFMVLFDEWAEGIAKARGLKDGDIIPATMLQQFWVWMNQELRPWFDEYKSGAGNQRFDTIVYRNAITSETGNKASEMWRKEIIRKNKLVRKASINIRNCLAVQQMRRNGKLPACPRW